jgi:hypothetical protein
MPGVGLAIWSDRFLHVAGACRASIASSVLSLAAQKVDLAQAALGREQLVEGSASRASQRRPAC